MTVHRLATERAKRFSNEMLKGIMRKEMLVGVRIPSLGVDRLMRVYANSTVKVSLIHSLKAVRRIAYFTRD